jgi:predicted GNAT family acetyltransferase
MNIIHSENEKKGRFFIEKDGEQRALMTYSKAGSEKIIIDHTEVDESLQGQGVGYRLVEAVVTHAREEQLKIMPLCPFAKAVFDKRSEYSDVLL